MRRSSLTDRDAWFELDDNAKFYPLIMTENTQSAFRLVVELKESVDPRLLAKAADDVLDRFPSFKVRMRRGLFWHYYVRNDAPCKVDVDDGIVLKRIWETTNNHYLFRLSYSDKHINFEVFHVLCDGKASLEFIKTLLFRYFELCGKRMEVCDGILDYKSHADPSEFEDSFKKNYKPAKISDIQVGSYAGKQTAYTVSGTKPMKAGLGVIRLAIPFEQLHILSRRYECSLTVFLSAVILNAIYNNKYHGKKLNKALLTFIPINMRPYFNSHTLRNFVTFSRAGIRKGDPVNEFSDFVRAVKRDLTADSRPETVERNMNAAVNLQRIFLIRFMPLALKEFVIKYGKSVFATSKHTICLSNVGKCDLPAVLAPFVENLFFVLNPSPKLPVSVSANTLRGVTNIVFSRCIVETQLECEFVRLLNVLAKKQDLPLDIEVSSNHW